MKVRRVLKRGRATEIVNVLCGLAQLEAPPNPELIVGVHLSDWHPLEVRPHGVCFSLRELEVANLAGEGVVAVGGTHRPRVVGNFVVVPDGWSRRQGRRRQLRRSKKAGG